MFDLQELIRTKYDRITIATKADNTAILNFFATIVMDTQELQLRYERDPDFFNFFDEQGTPGVVFLFKNDDESIGGISTITTRQCRVNGKSVLAGYAGDLRVSPKVSRKTRVHWRKVFVEIIANYQTIKEIGCPEYMVSVIIDGNADAKRALVKPGSNPVYREITNFNSINILGQICKPVCNLLNHNKLLKSGYTCRWADIGDYPAIKDFLYRENKTKQLGFDYTQSGDGELERRLNDWNNFTINSFLVLEKDNTIIACLAPWSNGNSRRIVIEKAPIHLRTLGAILPLWGQKPIKVNNELTTLYLTSVEIDSNLTRDNRAQIFGLMIDFLYADKHWNQYNLVSFLDSDNCHLAQAIQGKGYMYSKQKSTLYQLVSPDENIEERFLTVAKGELIGFDLATA